VLKTLPRRHYYISARAGKHHLGLFVYKITGSRTVSPRALQNLVLFCLTAGDLSVVSACTTQIRDIFFTVPACITFCVMTRSSVRFPTSLEKDLSATVYSTVAFIPMQAMCTCFSKHFASALISTCCRILQPYFMSAW